jgi:hypothetical protein
MNISNNFLKREIKEILLHCGELSKITFSYFNAPAKTEEIIAWEKKHQTKIPASYKDWLLFSNGSEISNGLVHLFRLNMIGFYNEFLQPEYVIFGTTIGDGEFLCFSRESGQFARIDHSGSWFYDDFKLFLQDFLLDDMLGNEKSSIKPLCEFNELEISERRGYLAGLHERNKPMYDSFIYSLRRYAVQGFWNSERDLIKQGKGTRDWTIRQQMDILNMRESDFIERKNANSPYDENCIAYVGHHMKSVYPYIEYASDPDNIQALTHEEHIFGAHGAPSQ